jgi:NADH dehydrogenase
MWLAVHLVYIIGFKHRLTTLLHWTVSFVGRGRSERTVTHQQIFARTALSRLGDEFSPSLPPDPDARPSWRGSGAAALVPSASVKDAPAEQQSRAAASGVVG